MIQKYLSKKLLTVIATAIIDILITTGQIPASGQESFILLLNGISGIYVIIQGIIDMIKATKGV